jgi:hypothetical protein
MAPASSAYSSSGLLRRGSHMPSCNNRLGSDGLSLNEPLATTFPAALAAGMTTKPAGGLGATFGGLLSDRKGHGRSRERQVAMTRSVKQQRTSW